MFIGLVLLLLGLAILLIWKGSDWITDSLVPVANKLGTSYIAITTLLVSFILSIPELFTVLYSGLAGHFNIGLGVIIGSVMINIGLTTGLSATLKPLTVEKPVAIRDGIFLIIAAAIVLMFGMDLNYSRSEGFVLLLLFIPYALNVWSFEKWRPHKEQKEKVENIKKSLSVIGHSSFLKFKPSLLTFFLGAAILVSGSFLFSFSLVNLSGALPLPEILVGLIFGAIGTGIPNITAAIQGTRKGYKDAAITETFGSNMFTLLVTLGIITVLQPFFIAGKLLYFDLTWMIIIHVLMLAFIFKGYHYREESLTRYEGVALVLLYLAIIIMNVIMF
ncbi:MAG: sodium:calcium antiporter [Nanoarchaeota archaeon]|nr:sodium:calcium antiporter [Nanoarchaeota archaeon]MBU1622950.1 sodium:calcium antiporter [Nanoarchaeota archaeon]